MYSSLFEHIKRYVALNVEEMTVLEACTEYKTIKKKDFLLKEGQVCNAQYFLVKGCLRMYFVQENGTEQIVQFAIENWWLSDYYSFDMEKPSRFYIQAIEDAEVISVKRQSGHELYTKIPQLERYFRLVLQRAYAAAQHKVYLNFSMSGEERYHHFNNSYPGFVQRIPQYMLASLLGFTPEFLSKVRGKKK